jgi:hypothetical protein
MERRLAELDRLDQGRRPRRRRSRARGGLVTLGAFTIFVVGTASMLWSEYDVRVSADGLEGANRLLPEVAAIDNGGSYEFLVSDGGEPVAYSPCRRLSIRVNDRLQPPGAHGVIEEAAARVSAATGLLITVDGTTDELPDRSDSRMSGPAWTGSGPAPILVAWTTPDQDPELRGRPAGVGGSVAHAANPTGDLRYVEGSASLDTPALAPMLSQPNGRALVRAVVMHELAHVVGLGHVDDPRELMYEGNVGVTSFGPGDLAGLARLGQGECF